MEAIVILPDHVHCVWTLGRGDTDFSTRWSLLKGNFSRTIEKGERISQSRAKRGERGLSQRRFWEPSAIKLTSRVTWITSIGIR
jgi:putative transposase